MPQGASVPALGLSNKAVYEGNGQKEEPEDEARISGKTQYPEVYFSPLDLEGIAVVHIKVLKEKCVREKQANL